MPIHRTPDGKIVEEKTIAETRKGSQGSSGRSATVDSAPGNERYDAKTVKLDGKSADQKPSDEQTRLVGARRNKDKDDKMQERAKQADAMLDPVVGWLVVVHGPGAGNSVRLSYGMNAIGRDKESQVTLDFGDDQITRIGHANLIYDPKNCKYYIQHGGGNNLTYLNDAPVLAPTELKGQEHIVLGDTTLRFMPLCGEDFDWNDFVADE